MLPCLMWPRGAGLSKTLGIQGLFYLGPGASKLGLSRSVYLSCLSMAIQNFWNNLALYLLVTILPA